MRPYRVPRVCYTNSAVIIIFPNYGRYSRETFTRTLQARVADKYYHNETVAVLSALPNFGTIRLGPLPERIYTRRDPDSAKSALPVPGILGTGVLRAYLANLNGARLIDDERNSTPSSSFVFPSHCIRYLFNNA